MNTTTKCTRPIRKICHLAIAAAAIAALSASGAQANTITAAWDGTTNNWTSAADWSPSTNYPNNNTPSGTDYNVDISAAGSGPYTVTLDNTAGNSGTVNVNSVTIDNANATLDQTSGTLDLTQQPGGTAGGAMDVQAGTYDITNATLANATLAIGSSGTFSDNSGTLQNVTLGSDLTLSANSVYTFIANTVANAQGLNFNGHTVNITGTNNTLYFQDAYNSTTAQYVGDSINGNVNLIGSGSGIQGVNGGLTINSGSTVTASSGSTNYIGGYPAVTNDGTIAATGGTSLTVDPNNTLANAGTIQASGGGTLSLTSTTLTNTGTVSISGTNTVLDVSSNGGTWSNTGTIAADTNATNAATETINLDGTFHPSDVGLASSGTNATFTPNGATVNIDGTLDNTSNTLTFNSSTGVWNLNNGGTIENGTLVADNQGSGASYLNIASGTLQNVTLGSDLTLSANSVYTFIANTVANAQGLNFNGHTVNITGTNNTLYFQDAYNSTTAQYVGDSINGNVNLIGSGSGIQGVNGGLTINSGSTVTASSGSTNYIGGYPAVTNDGTIAATGGTSLTVDPNNTLANAGTIQASGGGTLSLTSTTLTNTGTVSISGTNTVLDVSSNGGTWSNTGTIAADTNATNAATETINLDGTFHPSDVGLASSGTNATFTPNGATVNIDGTLDNTSNTLTFNSSTGVWNLNNGGTIENGTLVADNQGSGASYLNIASGTLQNVTLGSDLTLSANSVYTFIANTVANAQGLNFNGHTVNITGTNNTLYFQDAYNSTTAQYVGDSINGNVNLIGSGSGIQGVNGGLTINSGSTVTASSGSTNYIGGYPAVTNDGTIAATGGTSLTVDPNNTLANAGTIQASGGGTLSLTSTTLTNTGTVSISGTNTVLDVSSNGGTWSNTGTIAADTNATNAATETINLDGTFHPSDVGLASSGTNATFTPNGATVNIDGTLDNTSNTLTFNSSTGVWNLNNGGTIENGTLVADNQGSGASYLNIASGTLQNVTLGSDLTLSANSVYTFIANTVANAQGLNFNGHTVNITGTNNTLYFQDAYNSTTAQYVGDSINGNVNLIGSGSGIQGVNGGLTINSGSTVTASSGSTNYIGGYPAVTNDGTIAATGGTTLDIYPSSFTNAGTIQASGGSTITLQPTTFTNYSSAGGGTLTGGIYVADNGSLDLSAGATDNITTNAADVTLSGANSAFAQINTLAVNQGAFRVLNNRNFTAQAGFDNQAAVSPQLGLLQLGGGTFAITSGTFTNEGTVQGFGTVTPQVTNTGMIEATGGTLALSNGAIDPGTSSTLQSDAGATLDISGGSTSSTTQYLINNGSLTLGNNNVTVSTDYNNSNFGTGNSFNNHANVTPGTPGSGTGEILASGNVAMTVTNTTTSATGSSITLALGNIHVGSSTSQTFTINNTGTTGPVIRGAIQTTNLTDSRASALGGAQNFSPIALSSSSGPYSVQFNAGSDGSLNGQSVKVVSNFDNVGPATVNITGAAWNLAAPSVSPTTIALGDVHVGGSVTQNIAVGNTAPNDGFSEQLDGQLGTGSGNLSTNGASFSGLNAGSSLTPANALNVKLDTNAVGLRTGSATLALQSDGSASGNSGLGITNLTSQIITMSATAYRLANPVANSPSGTTINLGVIHVGDVGTQNISLTNNVPSDGFSENLDASLGSATGAAFVTNNPNPVVLTPGSTNTVGSLQVGVSTATAGTKTGTATLSLISDGTGIDTLGTTTLTPIVYTISATVNNYALPTILLQSGSSGAVLHEISSTQYSLNLGTTTQGAGNLFADLGFGNGATGPSDTVAGNFTLNAASFNLTGFNSFTGIGAGQNTTGQDVTLSDITAGTFSGSITYNPFGQNSSGYNSPFSPITINLSGTVNSSTPEPTTLALLAVGSLGLLVRRRRSA